MLSRLRVQIKQADPAIVEEWKWNVPVWSHDGLICTGETYKSAVKLTFANGAAFEGPFGLVHSSLEGKVRRAIDFHQGDKVDASALKASHTRRGEAERLKTRTSQRPRTPNHVDGHPARKTRAHRRAIS